MSQSLGRQLVDLERPDLRLRRPPLQHQLPAAAGRGPLRGAAACPERGRPRPATPPTPPSWRGWAALPHREADPGVPPAGQAASPPISMPCPPWSIPGRAGVHTTFNQTVAGHRPALLQRPEPAEHPHPDRAGQADPAGLRRRRPTCLLSAPTTRRSSCASWRTSPRTRACWTAFRQDEDIHAATAAEVFGVAHRRRSPRTCGRVAKMVNFGIIYGMSDYGLEQATELSREQAAQVHRGLLREVPRCEELPGVHQAEGPGPGLRGDPAGPAAVHPGAQLRQPAVREAAERMAINMPVQGTAADIIKVAMVHLQGEIDRRGCRAA